MSGKRKSIMQSYYKHIAEIQTKTTTKDGHGGIDFSWDNKFEDGRLIKCKNSPKYGSNDIIDNRDAFVYSHVIMIDLEDDEIPEEKTDRIVIDGKNYSIKAIYPQEGIRTYYYLIYVNRELE